MSTIPYFEFLMLKRLCNLTVVLFVKNVKNNKVSIFTVENCEISSFCGHKILWIDLFMES